MNYDGPMYAAIYAILRTDLGLEPEPSGRIAEKIANRLTDYSNARRAVDYRGYAVHHIDGNRLNNNLENLTLVRIER